MALQRASRSGSTASARDPSAVAASTSRSEDSAPRVWWRNRGVQGAFAMLVLVAIFGFMFPRMADYSDVWLTLGALTRIELAVLIAVTLWNLFSYWPFIAAALPGLRIREAAVSNLASTAAANTLPGGAAVGIGITANTLLSWGFRADDIARLTVVTGVWNNFIKLGLPVVALAALSITGEATGGLALASGVGVVVLVSAIVTLALALRSDAMAERIGALVGRAVNLLRRLARRAELEDVAAKARAFRGDIVELVARRWLWLAVSGIMSHLSLWLVLLVSLRQVGISDDEVSWASVLAAFAFVRLLSAVPLTPGGVGVAELGLTAALSHGLSRGGAAQVVAAVLLFRALTWFLPVPLGIGCYVFWRRRGSWRNDSARTEVATRVAT